MKLKSSLILIVAAFFILSCATIGPKSASQTNDSQTGVELALASGIQYYLEDIYDYDDVFFITQPVIRQTPDYFVILSRFNEDPFSTTEPVAEQTLASGFQYYLEDIYDYDYDQPFLITKTAEKN